MSSPDAAQAERDLQRRLLVVGSRCAIWPLSPRSGRRMRLRLCVSVAKWLSNSGRAFGIVRHLGGAQLARQLVGLVA